MTSGRVTREWDLVCALATVGVGSSGGSNIFAQVILPWMLLIWVLLSLLVLGAMVAVAAVVGAGGLVGRAASDSGGDRLGRSGRRLGAVLVAGSAVGLVVWMSAFLRDPVVIVDGGRTHCSAPIGDDLLPRVAEQCDAQGHDRRMQALVAGLTAGSATAIVLWSASRSWRRRSGRGSSSQQTWDGVDKSNGSRRLATE
jgi:hypothetical protein